MAERLPDATPDRCVAIRLGRVLDNGGDDPPLLTCGLSTGERVACMPSLVSGEVIGAVRVAHDRPLDDEEHQRIADTVRTVGGARQPAQPRHRAAARGH